MENLCELRLSCASLDFFSVLDMVSARGWMCVLWEGESAFSFRWWQRVCGGPLEESASFVGCNDGEFHGRRNMKVNPSAYTCDGRCGDGGSNRWNEKMVVEVGCRRIAMQAGQGHKWISSFLDFPLFQRRRRGRTSR